MEELDPLLGHLALLLGALELDGHRVLHQGAGPGKVEGTRERRLVSVDRVEVEVGHGLHFSALEALTFEAEGDVAHDAIKVTPEAGAALGRKPLQRAALLEALQEDLLGGVLDVLGQVAVTPTGLEIGLCHRDVPGGELLPLLRPALGCTQDHRPARRLRGGHEGRCYPGVNVRAATSHGHTTVGMAICHRRG